MNAELAELIALVAHGNAFVHGLRPPTELTQSNSTFQYVQSVRFVRPLYPPSAEPTTVATTTAAWFEAIKSAGGERMWLVIPAVTDHNLVGFANAGPGAILVTLRGSAEVWTGSWEVISPQPSDDRIWTVSYESMPASLGDVAVGSGSVDDAMDELRAVLGDAADFAVSDPGLRNFAKWLRDAVGLLDDPHPTAPYHPDMLPDVGYSLESRRLLAASTRAWVFGGLGSWNDVYLEDESIGTEYERISSRLWQAVLGGLESAVNAFEPVP